MSKVNYRLKSLKFGPVPDDGTMGTILAPLGKTYKGTASLKMDEATVFDVEVEEDDDPEESFSKKGKKTVAFSLVDWTPETIQSALGGTVTNGAWEEPDASPNIEQSCQMISQTGILIEFPRGKLSGLLNAEFKEDGVGLIDCTFRPLKPAGAGIKATKISVYQPPTVNAGVDKASALATTNLVGTAAAYRGTVSSQLWTCLTKPVGAPAPGITTPAALNTNITGMVNGIYIFQLAATDSNDFTGTDKITVTVTIP